MMDRCWIVRPACYAGLVVCVCLLVGCGGESPAPGEPESSDAWAEAPPFEPDSPQSPAARNQAGLSRPRENQAADSATGLLIPPSNRGATPWNQGEEPPLPDSVLSQVVGAGDGELRLPLDRRPQPTPPGSEEPPQPETLALTTTEPTDATLTSSAEIPVTTDAAPAADTTSERPERPLEIHVSEPSVTAPVRSLPETPRTLSATLMVDSAIDHPLEIHVSEPSVSAPVRSALNSPPTLGARAAGPVTDHPLKIQVSEPTFTAPVRPPLNSPPTLGARSAVIKRPATAADVARQEPQPTLRMTIPIAEPEVPTPSASVMKLRPAPDAARRPKTTPQT